MAKTNIIGVKRVIKHVSIQSANLGKGATAPVPVIIGNYSGWEYDIGDDSVLDIELSHSLDTSKSASIHLVWAVNETYALANAEANWQANYSVVPYNNGEALDAPTRTSIITTGDINIPAVAKSPVHSTNLIIPASHIGFAFIVGVTLSRIALVAGANPTAKPTIIGVHLEYTSDKLGT